MAAKKTGTRVAGGITGANAKLVNPTYRNMSSTPTVSRAAVARSAPTVSKAAVASATVKTGTPKPAKKKKYNDNLINRILENWTEPYDEIGPDGQYYPASYDKYPYGSLTGRKK